MKKFYSTLLAGALVALGASAAQVGDVAVKTGSNRTLTFPGAEIQPLKVGALQNSAKIVEKGDFKSAKQTAKTAKGRAASLKDISGEYEVNMSALISSSPTGMEIAKIGYDDEFEEVVFDIPSATEQFGIPFICDYDESTGTLTVEAIQWGSMSSGEIVAQIPISGQSPVSSISFTYDAATKSFNVPTGSGLSIALMTSSSFSSIQGYYFAVRISEILMVDGDYKIVMSVDDECTPTHDHEFTIEAGADVAELYIFDLDGDIAPSYFTNYYGNSFFKEYGVKLDSKSVSLTFNPAEYMEETGYYTIMAGAYDASGNLRRTALTQVFVNLDENDSYQTIGQISFIDNIISQVYQGRFTNMSVEIQENVNTPGLFRLVNLYKGHQYLHNEDCDHYFYLDARDPDFVNIPISSTGTDFGYGSLVVGSFGGALGWSKEQCAENGYQVGKLSNRNITFPVGSVLCHESGFNTPGSWSYVNNPNNGGLPIQFSLPKLTLNLTIINEDENPVAGAAVSVEGVSGTTGADGKVKLTLPADVDYLATVTVNITPAEGEGGSRQIKLNGADNDAVINMVDVSGIEDIFADEKAEPVEYFNLQGVKITNPAPGQIVIRRQGAKSVKILVK